MTSFCFYLHDEAGSSPSILTKTLRSVDAAKVFGQRLLIGRPGLIAVEVHSGDTRITTIKQIGHGQISSTPSHEVAA